jgi:hypothetical protein
MSAAILPQVKLLKAYKQYPAGAVFSVIGKTTTGQYKLKNSSGKDITGFSGWDPLLFNNVNPSGQPVDDPSANPGHSRPASVVPSPPSGPPPPIQGANNSLQRMVNVKKLNQNNIVQLKPGKGPVPYKNSGRKFVITKKGRTGRFSLLDDTGKNVTGTWGWNPEDFNKNKAIDREPFQIGNKAKFSNQATATKYGKSANNVFTVTGRSNAGKLLLDNSTGKKYEGEWNPLNFIATKSNVHGQSNVPGQSNVGANVNKKASTNVIANSGAPVRNPEDPKINSEGQFIRDKTNTSRKYMIVGLTSQIGKNRVLLKPALDYGGDADDEGLKDGIKEIKSSELLKDGNYEIIKLRFRLAPPAMADKFSMFPDFKESIKNNTNKKTDFFEILGRLRGDGFHIGKVIDDYTRNNLNEAEKNINFTIILPFENSFIQKLISSGNIEGKYTTRGKVQIFADIADVLEEWEYDPDYPPSDKVDEEIEEENNNGTRFKPRNLDKKSNMIANIIATDRFLERDDVANGNIGKLQLDRYFKDKYTMTKKRALHNIISNILLKEVIRPGRFELMKTIIEKLFATYQTTGNTALTKHSLLDSIIYIIDKLLLFNLTPDKNGIAENKRNPRNRLLEIIEKGSSELGDGGKIFIQEYISTARDNQKAKEHVNTPEETKYKAKKAIEENLFKKQEESTAARNARAVAEDRVKQLTAELNVISKNTSKLNQKVPAEQKLKEAQNALKAAKANEFTKKQTFNQARVNAAKKRKAIDNGNDPNSAQNTVVNNTTTVAGPIVNGAPVAVGAPVATGGYKLKKTIKKPKGTKKVKKITTYTKAELEKIAKKNKVTLKRRDGAKKNKEELFKALKRQGLV